VSIKQTPTKKQLLNTKMTTNNPRFCPSCGHDQYVMIAANAALNTLNRKLDREQLKVAILRQDFEVIRKIIRKGGSVDDVIKFLDSPTI